MNRAFWALLVLVACGKKQPVAAADAGPKAALSVAVPGSARPALPAPAAAPTDARLILVERWSSLLTAHDSAGLGAVYARRVELYGQTLARDRVVALKAAAFAHQPDYTQSIGPITLQPRDANHVRALFDKSWSSAGKVERVVGTLLLAKDGEEWRIAAENDRKTESYLAGRGLNECWEFAAAAVASTKEARRWLDGPINPDAGHASNGSRVMLPDDAVIADVDVHESHEDHVVPLAWFEVNVETGEVQQTSALDWESDQPIRLGIDPDLVSKMKTACLEHVRAVHAHPATTSP